MTAPATQKRTSSSSASSLVSCRSDPRFFAAGSRWSVGLFDMIAALSNGNRTQPLWRRVFDDVLENKKQASIAGKLQLNCVVFAKAHNLHTHHSREAAAAALILEEQCSPQRRLSLLPHASSTGSYKLTYKFVFVALARAHAASSESSIVHNKGDGTVLLTSSKRKESGVVRINNTVKQQG